MVITEKVRAKLGDYDYGVFEVSALSAGANTASAGSFGLTKAWVVSMGLYAQATASAAGTSVQTISTPENGGIGSGIVLNALTDGDGAILEVMGW